MSRTSSSFLFRDQMKELPIEFYIIIKSLFERQQLLYYSFRMGLYFV